MDCFVLVEIAAALRRGAEVSGVLFMRNVNMEGEMDRWIGAASAVLRALHGTVMVKRQLSQKVKLPIFQLVSSHHLGS